MDELLQIVKKRIDHSRERHEKFAKELKEKENKLSNAGHWNLGYQEGYASALDNIEDFIEKTIKELNKKGER